MNVFNSLSLAEQARQLANPEGSIGVAVAEWLNDNNAQSNAEVLEALHIEPSCRVLEIGFGNGREAAHVATKAADVEYVGIDISATMIAEAERFNAELIAAGRASFHLTPADRMPFPDASFDRVFSIGVIHFWADPSPSLIEIRRVLRPSSLAVMGCMNPRAPRPFAREVYGVYLRSAEEWAQLFRQAGFRSVDSRCLEVPGIGPDGGPIKRYVTRSAARP